MQSIRFKQLITNDECIVFHKDTKLFKLFYKKIMIEMLVLIWYNILAECVWCKIDEINVGWKCCMIVMILIAIDWMTSQRLQLIIFIVSIEIDSSKNKDFTRLISWRSLQLLLEILTNATVCWNAIDCSWLTKRNELYLIVEIISISNDLWNTNDFL